MADWLTISAAAKSLDVSRATVFYYIRTGRVEHRHTFTREAGHRTEVKVPAKVEKLGMGELKDRPSSKCAECRR